jgi:hypothetical protein
MESNRIINSSKAESTLRISIPYGQTVIITIFMLLLILFTVEATLRMDIFVRYFPNSNFGGTHAQFEKQLARLEKVEITDGPIDCIFIGSSLVWLGLNPEVFENSYWRETGDKLHCFNFGVEAMPATVVAGLVPTLINEYKPRLIIYGIHARDLGTPVLDEDSQSILQTPWYRYQQGDLTITGWLASHSRIYRNLEYLPELLRLNIVYIREQMDSEDSQRHGF